MANTKELIERLNNLTPEQLEQVGGGLTCTGSEVLELVNNLTAIYESAIDFTSHVIERVDGAL